MTTRLVLIISRHHAVAEFVQEELPRLEGLEPQEFNFVLRDHVGPEDVRGAWVAGVLPMHLAALTERFWAVEFPAESAPRGTELTLDQMRAAGARLVEYFVRPIRPPTAGGMEPYAQIDSSGSPYATTLMLRVPRGTVLPARGDLIDRGTAGQVHTVDFAPDPTAPLVVALHGRVKRVLAGSWRVAVEMAGTDGHLTIGWAEPGTALTVACGYRCRQTRALQVLGPGPEGTRDLRPSEIGDFLPPGRSLLAAESDAGADGAGDQEPSG